MLIIEFILEQIVVPFGVTFSGGMLACVAAELLLKKHLCLTPASRTVFE